MILRHLLSVTALLVSLWHTTVAEVAPEITWVEEGYNFIAKLPCHGSPFLYQDTSKGEKEPWSERSDDNALLLNISLPYTHPSISINTIPIFPTQAKLHPIHAVQVVQDISPDALTTLLTTNQLAASGSHEPDTDPIPGSAGAGAFLGLSYRSSLRHISSPNSRSAALLFHFDIFALHSDLLNPSLEFKMESREQKLVQMVLLQKPIVSAFDTPSFEIVGVELVARSANLYPLPHSSTSQSTSSSSSSSTPQEITMHFHDWDIHGRRGTLSHRISRLFQSLGDFLDSGVWALFAFLGGVIALFVCMCLFCIFGADWCCPSADEYERAQSGKGKRGAGKRDLEMGREGGGGRGGGGGNGYGSGGAGRLMQMQFKSPEELGLLGRGKVVGVGKSD